MGETVLGTKGEMTLGVGPWGMAAATPRMPRGKEFEGQNPYQLEHNDLMASIRGSGPYRFDADYGATSSLTAVMGRMATYSGKLVDLGRRNPFRVASRARSLRLRCPAPYDA